MLLREKGQHWAEGLVLPVLWFNLQLHNNLVLIIRVLLSQFLIKALNHPSLLVLPSSLIRHQQSLPQQPPPIQHGRQDGDGEAGLADAAVSLILIPGGRTPAGEIPWSWAGVIRVGHVASSLVGEAHGPEPKEENIVESADESGEETSVRQNYSGDKNEQAEYRDAKVGL